MLNSCEGLPSSPKKCICQNRPSSRNSSRTFYTAIQREQTDKFKTPTAAVFAMIFVLIVQMILGSCHLVTLFVCVASIWRAGSRPDFKNWTQSKAAAIAIQEQQLRFGSFWLGQFASDSPFALTLTGIRHTTLGQVDNCKKMFGIIEKCGNELGYHLVLNRIIKKCMLLKLHCLLRSGIINYSMDVGKWFPWWIAVYEG